MLSFYEPFRYSDIILSSWDTLVKEMTLNNSDMFAELEELVYPVHSIITTSQTIFSLFCPIHNQLRKYYIPMSPPCSDTRVGIYSKAERREKILRFRKKRDRYLQHKTCKKKYECRRRFATTRKRVGGRFI